MHSAARLTYTLDGSYRRFQAEMGIDDTTAGRGSIRGRIYVDGRQQYASETIRGGQPPVPLRLDVGGASRIALVGDFADYGDVLDCANWLNAHLTNY